jgi:hypothetical protein
MTIKERNETILQDIDEYILTQAGKLMQLYMGKEHKAIDKLEIDELAQRSRIKLWKTLGKIEIFHLYPYVRRIVYSEFIDMKRQQKRTLPLPIDENEQPISPNDPEAEFLQHGDTVLLLHTIARMITSLPPRQRLAMLCLLHDQVDDLAQCQTIFRAYGIDVESTCWPTEKEQRQLLLASLSVARQKFKKKR